MPDVRVGAFLVRLREGLSVRGVGRDHIPLSKQRQTRRFSQRYGRLVIPNRPGTNTVMPRRLTIIKTWLSPPHEATNDQKQKDYIHWLAKELRLAAGMEAE